MKIRVLGCSGALLPNANQPAFLVDEKILLDAGTIGNVLSADEQWKIRHILLTHAHLDHIVGIPFFLDNIVVKNIRHQVMVIGIKETLKAIKEHLLNDKIWPDFSKIPDKNSPVLALRDIKYGVPFKIDKYTIYPLKVRHTVPAAGYIIEKGRKRLLYTGDTGPVRTTWNEVNRLGSISGRVDAIIIEVSFPNRMKELAIKSGHLTPNLLYKELQKLNNLPKKILITHPKPLYYKLIKDEINKLMVEDIEILSDNMIITI